MSSADARARPSRGVLGARARGFTLVELVIATALGSVLVATVTVATVSVYRSAVAMQQAADADDVAKTLLDAMLVPTQQLGGSSLRPWAAVSTQCVPGMANTGGAAPDLPACGTADRLHFIDVAEGSQCTIQSYNGASGSLTALDMGGDCCISAANGYPAEGRLVAIVPNVPAGGGWQLKRCVPSNAGCGCTLSDVPGGVSVPPLPGVDVETDDWAGGLVVPGQTVTFYLDDQKKELRSREDANGDGIPEDRLMSDYVYDLQVHFGYDDAPTDGIVDDTWSASLDPDRATSLRMVRIGIVAGAPSGARITPTSARVTGGPVITSPSGVVLRGVEGAVTLRNLLIFY
jgi:prepilin-type N-terminal cleavage/methylation domain-containing protein